MEDFIKEIDAFLAKTGMSEKQFGLSALNDHHFMRDIRKKDRHPNMRTVERVRKFMRSWAE